MEKLGYPGIDQYGKCYKIKKYPRKELMEQIGRSSAHKMYVDLKSGGSRHDGYIIGGYWISVYTVCSWR